MKKTLGFATPFIITILTMVFIAISALIARNTSSDGWAALGAAMMVFMLGGIILIIYLIVSLVMHYKQKGIYWLYVLYGYVGFVSAGLFVFFVISVYNFFVG